MPNKCSDSSEDPVPLADSGPGLMQNAEAATTCVMPPTRTSWALLTEQEFGDCSQAKQPSNTSAKQFLRKDDMPEPPFGAPDPTLKDLLVVDLSGLSWRAVRRALRAARAIERTERRIRKAAMSSQASPAVVSEDTTLGCVHFDPKDQVNDSSDRGENRNHGPEDRTVLVEMPHERTIPFVIHPGEPIGALRNRVAQRAGLDLHQIRLIHRCKDICDAESCDILRNGSTMKALLRLHGGVNDQEPTQSPNKTNPFMDVNALFDLLRKRDIALLRGSWLLKRAGFVFAQYARETHPGRGLPHIRCGGWTLSDQKPRPLPRRQELEAAEAEAYLPPEEVESMYKAARDELKEFAVPVCGLSYCWEGAGAPDPEGRVLQALAQLLADNTGDFCKETDLDFGAPRPTTSGYPEIGVFIDFSSVFQKDRTDAEELSFKAALAGMNCIYGHRSTFCALLYNQDEHLAVPRDSRGWPVFEELMSSLLKDTGWHQFGGRSKLMATDMERKQKPPLPPADFDVLVKTLTFTSKADSGMVAKLYRRAVMDGLSALRKLRYSELPWSDAELATLGRTLIEAEVSSIEDVHLAGLPAKMGEGASPFWRALMADNASVRSLTLSDLCSMEELPTTVEQLTSLEKLDISGCRSLKELPLSFGELKELKVLNITYCSSLQELLLSFGDLKELKVLYMAGCSSLQELPASFGQLAGLKELVMCACTSLQELPASFGQLAVLQTLQMSGCASLRELPASFGQLAGLEELEMSKCTSLRELPASFGQLAGLKRLQMYGCTSLQELPVGGLSSLELLDLRDCTSLTKLVTGTEEVLPSLKEMFFDSTKLSPKREPLKSVLKRPDLKHDSPRSSCCVVG